MTPESPDPGFVRPAVDTALEKTSSVTDQDRLPADFLTVDQAAYVLRVSKQTVYRLVEREDLPAFRFGQAIRIARDELVCYIERSRTVGP